MSNIYKLFHIKKFQPNLRNQRVNSNEGLALFQKFEKLIPFLWRPSLHPPSQSQHHIRYSNFFLLEFPILRLMNLWKWNLDACSVSTRSSFVSAQANYGRANWNISLTQNDLTAILNLTSPRNFQSYSFYLRLFGEALIEQ